MTDPDASTRPQQPAVVPRRQRAAAVGAVTLAIGVSAAWAFWPQRHTAPVIVEPMSEEPHSPAPSVVPLDLAVFRTPLWIVPPPPPKPVEATPPPPPPPLKLQLIGISMTEGTPSAMLFDPDAGRIVTVTQGQVLAEKTIERIDSHEVVIRDRAGVRRLSLRVEGAALPGAGGRGSR